MRLIVLAAFLLLSATPAFAATDARCAKLISDFGPGKPVVVSASGLRYHVLTPGHRKLVDGNVVIQRYVVCLANGTFLEATPKDQPFSFTLGAKQVIRGAEEGSRLIGVGGEIELYLPYRLAYGTKGAPPEVPPRSDLVYYYNNIGFASVALSTQLKRAYDSGGIAAMKSAYARAAASGFKNTYSSEDDTNYLGYILLKRHHADAAVVALGFNVARFPRSWNAYDSLGDAERAAGHTALAIANYRRALQLNPKDENAVIYIQKLEGR